MTLLASTAWSSAINKREVSTTASSPVATIDTAGISSYASSLVAASSIQLFNAKPSQQVTDFNAIGDSFTAGIGSNGRNDYDPTSGDCRRYKEAYPYELQEDPTWDEINDNRNPTLHHGACSGATMDLMVQHQLTPGEDFRRVPYLNFGKPQLVVLTISGNDADFGK